ncbi:hypothetical protein PDE_00837 [Penicillium oxalicum 114-2]|uniref:Uncharacterized protein n=1 Tax=Penicillium oxalicum (strain 114-2 / CGMCC 5302) TaxID=933388 RepID=S7ZB53_PENO1|nr:hypothetical protein PDE_00837 [Penicillium oxalicum 114-2]
MTTEGLLSHLLAIDKMQSAPFGITNFFFPYEMITLELPRAAFIGLALFPPFIRDPGGFLFHGTMPAERRSRAWMVETAQSQSPGRRAVQLPRRPALGHEVAFDWSSLTWSVWWADLSERTLFTYSLKWPNPTTQPKPVGSQPAQAGSTLGPNSNSPRRDPSLVLCWLLSGAGAWRYSCVCFIFRIFFPGFFLFLWLWLINGNDLLLLSIAIYSETCKGAAPSGFAPPLLAPAFRRCNCEWLLN